MCYTWKVLQSIWLLQLCNSASTSTVAENIPRREALERYGLYCGRCSFLSCWCFLEATLSESVFWNRGTGKNCMVQFGWIERVQKGWRSLVWPARPGASMLLIFLVLRCQIIGFGFYKFKRFFWIVIVTPTL